MLVRRSSIVSLANKNGFPIKVPVGVESNSLVSADSLCVGIDISGTFHMRHGRIERSECTSLGEP